MIIQCEACKTKFRVGDDKVKPPGIKVRCSKCGEVFFFEYSLHEDKVPETSPDPFAQEQQEDPAAETPPPVEKEQPEVIDEPLTESPAETLNFKTPDNAYDELSAPGVEESNEESAGLNTETSDQSINPDNEPQEQGPSSDPFLNLEIDHLDDMVEEKSAPKEDVPAEDFKPPPEDPVLPPPDEKVANEFKSPNLSLDQDVLEQTYTKGTVASSSDLQEPRYAASVKTAPVKRYRRNKGGGGVFKRLTGWIFAIVLLAALFLVSMFLLNETKIYPNDYFSRFDNYARSLYGGSAALDLRKNIKIKDDNGSWQSSKYGQVFVVSGEAVNRSESPINYLKLRVYYISEGTNIFIQELYAGNTLSKREIKNSTFNSIQAKLNRKNGDISYDDANNLDGLNFDIQPGEVVPFYSIFPAKEKILGLKYRVEVVEYDSADITENP